MKNLFWTVLYSLVLATFVLQCVRDTVLLMSECVYVRMIVLMFYFALCALEHRCGLKHYSE